MTNDTIVARVTDFGIAIDNNPLSTEEAEELLRVLPALIVEAKGAYKKRLQDRIVRSEGAIEILRKELESLT